MRLVARRIGRVWQTYRAAPAPVNMDEVVKKRPTIFEIAASFEKWPVRVTNQDTAVSYPM